MKRKLNEHDVPEEVEEQNGASEPSDKKAANSFASLHLDARLLQAVKKQKFVQPTSVQLKAIPLILEGKDVLARAKTGSGKTLAYLLPAIHGVLQRAVRKTASKQTSVLVLVPTKELANQITSALTLYTAFCAQDVRFENICRTEDVAVTKTRLERNPDIVIATPSRATHWMNLEALQTAHLKQLIIDEADLVLSYGHEDDIEAIAKALPAGTQKVFTSATLRAEVDTLMELFFKDVAPPSIVDLSAEEAAEKPTLAQYTVPTAEQDKFLLIYTIFKLQLIKGKVIIFVADVDRCYRVKLFLEQFGIRSCVLNSELPVNSRLHVVAEFNRGLYDIIIAADENEVVGNESSKRRKRRAANAKKEVEQKTEDDKEEDEEEEEAAAEEEVEGDKKPRGGNEEKTDAEMGDAADATEGSALVKQPSEPRGKRRNDREFGVSRGIDFRNVSCVLNFDLPISSRSYTHRIGRTARAGRTGMALSFYVPRDQYRKHKPTSIEQCQFDEQVLSEIKSSQEQRGAQVGEWAFDMSKLEGFRYRLGDALRAVTRIAVREARTKELRLELLKSDKLKRHFEENPEDLRHLRHDTETHAIRQQPHLKHVPDYLLPAGGKQAVTQDVGFVGLRKEKENRLRKARAFNKGRGKGRIAKGKGLDPLKSLNARGRGKK